MTLERQCLIYDLGPGNIEYGDWMLKLFPKIRGKDVQGITVRPGVRLVYMPDRHLDVVEMGRPGESVDALMMRAKGRADEMEKRYKEQVDAA